MRAFAARILNGLRPVVTSRIGLIIVGINLLALTVLVLGIFAITENRRGLVQAKLESLTQQANIIANVLVETAVDTSPAPTLDAAAAREVLSRLSRINVPEETRALIYNNQAQLVADSRLIAGAVGREELPPPGEPGLGEEATSLLETWLRTLQTLSLSDDEKEALQRTVLDDVRLSLQDARPVRGVRRGPAGERVVSVTLPIQPIQAVVGAVTYESYDLDALIAAERQAIVPYILFAAFVTALSAGGLTIYIAFPIRRLADAAREVRLAGGRRVPLPSMGRRGDEIGDLGRAFSAMTNALYDRLDAIESFAADVSHEIKNPLTSIRSAAEVLPRAKDEERRDRLIAVIQHDVRRLDRLITDISSASRLDAELAREDLAAVDLNRLLRDLASSYDPDRAAARGVTVRVDPAEREAVVQGHEGPLSRVFLNLIDNAITFSPPGGEVKVKISRAGAGQRPTIRIRIEDQGTGIPAENLETIFERFYTQRPEGVAFGTHSGLGLSICRQVVQAHGGRIHAENCLDQEGKISGARFIVELPSPTR